MNDHAGGKSACGREMGNNEFPPLFLGKADHSSLADFLIVKFDSSFMYIA